MKGLKRSIGFVFAFVAVMAVFCLTSFAADNKYTGNVIPKMTSNTTPSGIAIASSIWDDKYSPWKAFNQSNSLITDAWATQKDITTGWLEYDFNEQKCISKYTLVSRVPVYETINEMPRDWTFEGWDEQLSMWIVLDTRISITDWQQGVKKEFEFINKNLYKKYRINITANVGYSVFTCIGKMEMMEAIEVPTNLLAKADTLKVNLSWDIVTGAETYNIKRSTTPKGPYTTIDTTSAHTYTDNTVINGSTYYYVVSAVNEGVESENSNEVSATPTSSMIISGTFYADQYNEGWNLNKAIDGRRHYTGHIDFGQTLPKVPTVFAALKYIDTDNRTNTRILVNVENVTADGFDITFETWADSIVWGLGANWIAFI